MLLLAPPNLTEDARAIAEDTLTAAGPRCRWITITRPLSQTIRLVRSKFFGAQVVVAVGGTVTSALMCKAPVLYVPNGAPSAKELRALRKLGEVHLLTSSSLTAAYLQRLGIRFATINVNLPDTHLPRRRTARDEALRGELGLRPTDRLVYAAGPAHRASGHYEALWATSILSFATGGQWKLLISGEGSGVPRLIQFAMGNDPSALLLGRDVLSDFTPVAGLAASDLAVDFGTGPRDIRPVLQAQAMGVPVLVAPNSSAADLVPPTAVSPDLTSRMLARRITEMADVVPEAYPIQRIGIPNLRVILRSLRPTLIPA